MTTNEIETTLRRAPRPIPPPGLRDRLLNSGFPSLTFDVQENNTPRENSFTQELRPGGILAWLRRWWPVLIPGGATLVCLGIMAAQQAQLRELGNATPKVTAQPVTSSHPPDPVSMPVPVDADVFVTQENEIARLRSLVAQLTEEVTALERTADQRGRSPLAPGQDFLNAEELALLEEAKGKADRIQCVNHLKQIGLAVRIWANDNEEQLPDSLFVLSNELAAPKLLVCPSDTSRQPATDWTTLTAANCTYEYLAAATTTEDPARVMTRCYIHSNVGLVDGSVQMTQPDRLMYIDGKLYLKPVEEPVPHSAPANRPTSPGSAEEKAREAFMRRYGLTPPDLAPGGSFE